MNRIINLIILQLFTSEFLCYNIFETNNFSLSPKIVQLSDESTNERVKREDYWGDNISWNENQEKIFVDDGSDKVSIWSNTAPDKAYFSSSSNQQQQPPTQKQIIQEKSSYQNNYPQTASYPVTSYQNNPSTGYYSSNPGIYYNQPRRSYISQPQQYPNQANGYYNRPNSYYSKPTTYYNQPSGLYNNQPSTVYSQPRYYNTRPLYTDQQPLYYYPAYNPVPTNPVDKVVSAVQR